MIPRYQSLLCLLILVINVAEAQNLSATSQRVATVSEQSVMTLPPPCLVDTLLTPDVPFTPMAVSLHGYAKRLSDSKESFILRNETRNYHISRVLLKLQYTTEQGRVIHSREELVECDIAPGMTQMIALGSFDVSKIYYYYTTPPRRASGTPYRIKYDILRYDIVVE